MTGPARRVVLGADVWQVLLERLPGLRDLPAPLRPQDGPVLDAGQRRAALTALQRAGLLAGPGAAGLHRTLRACLLVQVRAAVCVEAVVQLGSRRTTGRFACAGPLAAGLVRCTDDVAGGRRTGPVELLACRSHDLPAEVWRLLDRPGAHDTYGGRAVLLRRSPAPVREQVLLRGGAGWMRPVPGSAATLEPADEGDVRALLVAEPGTGGGAVAA